MSEYINIKMIEDGLMAKVIKAKIEGDEIVVTIGDGWFWIGIQDKEYKLIDDIPFGVLVNKIKDTLDEFYKHTDTFEDEYLYYYYYLCENI